MKKNSIFLGTTRLRDLPGKEHEFFRVWFIKFNNRTKRFWFLRDLVESLLKNKRFISYAEYQEIYKDKIINDGKEIQKRYPVYNLLGIGSEKARQRFINAHLNKIDNYYHLMNQRNKLLWELSTRSISFGSHSEHVWEFLLVFREFTDKDLALGLIFDRLG